MASLVLGVAGSVVGGMIGGPMGAQIGYALGSMIGNALFPPPAQEGAKLSDLKMMTSAYGQAVPWVFGTARLAGNVFWSTNKIEHKHSTSAGKGGQKVNSYSYSISLALLLCEGPISGIRKIWANGVLVWDAGSGTASSMIASSKLAASIRVYLGGDDQEPDAFMQARDGVDSTPAYLDQAYLFLQDWDLTDYGGSVPNIEVEVVAQGEIIGPRKMSTVPYKFAEIDASSYNASASALYFATSSAGTIGLSYGWPTIAGVHNGMVDIIAEGTEEAMGGGAGVPAPAYDRTCWTLSQDGDFVGSGTRSDMYPGCVSRLSTMFATPTHLYPFEFHWGGVAGTGPNGAGQFFIARAGSTVLAGAERYAADYSPWGVAVIDLISVVDPLSIPTGVDNSGIMSALYGIAWDGVATCKGILPSGDGKLVLITVQDGASSVPNKWVRFRMNGYTATLDSTGPIESSPGRVCAGWGRQPGTAASSSGMLEEDGSHVWNTGGGYIVCWEIGTDGVMRHLYSDSGSYQTDFAVSVYATAGVCFLAGMQFIQTYTRNATIARSTVPLSEVVRRICLDAGLTDDQIDTSQLTDEVLGIVYGQQMTYRSMLPPLQTAYPFDAVETDEKIVFVKRGMSPVVLIPEDDLAAHDGMSLDEPPDQWKLTRMQELELPNFVSIDYFAADADMQDGSQYDARQTTYSQNKAKLQLPMALTDNQAKQICMMTLYSLWEGRHTVEISTSLAYSYLNPTDVIQVVKDGKTITGRIVKRTDGGNGIITFTLQSENPSVYTQVALGGVVRPGTQTLQLASNTEMVVFDAPPLTDSFGQVPMLFIAANGYNRAWTGAELFRSTDGGTSYNDTGTAMEQPATIGRAITALPAPHSFAIFDEASSVDIFLTNDTSELSSDTELNVLSGSNNAWIGGEIVGFKYATQIQPRQYRLTGLLRGRLGTEDFAASHAAGDSFVLLRAASLQTETLDSSQIGQTLVQKGVSFGMDVSDARALTTKFTGRNMRPLSLAGVNAHKNTLAGDWTGSLGRRTRIGGAWRDGVDAQLGEAAETYDVEILNGAGTAVVRTFSGLTSPTFTYTSAMQIADFGSAQGTIRFRAYQTNQIVGRGPSLQDWIFTFYATALNGGPVIIGGSFAWNFLAEFDGPDGATTTTDSSGNGYSITMAGGPALSWSQPIFNKSSIRFNGSGYATIDPAVANIPDGDFTISMYFQTTQAVSGYGVALMTRSTFHGGDFSPGDWTILSASNWAPMFYWADYSTDVPFLQSAVAGFNDGMLHKIEWIRVGNTHYMAMDEVIVASRTVTKSFTPGTTGITLGNDLVFGGRGFVGTIDQVAIVYGTGTHTTSGSMPVNLIPEMTGNTSPSGVASASSAYGGGGITPPWWAFAPIANNNGWITDNGQALPSWLAYQFATPQIVKVYRMHPWDADTFPSRCPTEWKFQASNDGSNWTDLDSQTGFTNWGYTQNRQFLLGNTKAYLYYRLYITNNGGNGYTGLRNLAMLG
jgi:hypothetical protein